MSLATATLSKTTFTTEIEDVQLVDQEFSSSPLHRLLSKLSVYCYPSPRPYKLQDTLLQEYVPLIGFTRVACLQTK